MITSEEMFGQYIIHFLKVKKLIKFTPHFNDSNL